MTISGCHEQESLQPSARSGVDCSLVMAAPLLSPNDKRQGGTVAAIMNTGITLAGLTVPALPLASFVKFQ